MESECQKTRLSFLLDQEILNYQECISGHGGIISPACGSFVVSEESIVQAPAANAIETQDDEHH